MPADRNKSSSVRNSATPKNPQEKRGNSFHFRYLGSSSLALNKTGFGSVQSALRDLYIPYITQRDSQSRESSTILREDGLVLNFWNAMTRQYQDEFYPYDFVTYVDYIKFGITKGKKRYFGYFCRYRDRRDVLPESVLIPIEKKYKFIIKMNHLPLIACVLRRPRGVQFLDCHVMQADSELDARNFYEIVQSRTSRQTQLRAPSVTSIDDITFHTEISNMRNRWKSQPKLTSETRSSQSLIDKHSDRSERVSSVGDSSRQPSIVSRDSLFSRFKNRQVSSQSETASKWSTSVSSNSSYAITDRRTSTTSSREDEDMRQVFNYELESRLLRTKSDTNIHQGHTTYLIPIDISEDSQDYPLNPGELSPTQEKVTVGKVSKLINQFESESPPTSPTRKKPIAMIRPSRRASDCQHGINYKHSGRNSPRRIKRISSHRKENCSINDNAAAECMALNEQHAKVTKSAEIEEDVFSMNFRGGQHDFQSALGYLP